MSAEQPETWLTLWTGNIVDSFYGLFALPFAAGLAGR
jgi:hypothetical protein